MARSPRKHPVADADAAPYLRPLDSLPCPLDPRTLFARPSPIELEVGCGKGLFLEHAATSRPDTNWLGIEISTPYARLCAGRLARRHAGNALVIPGDARRLVEETLVDGCLAAVHVYFPDPWWKARHRKRRVLAADFLAHVARALGPAGVLHVWTDVEEYFRETLAIVEAGGFFGEPQTVAERPAEHDLDYRTHFERRTRLAGEPVWRTFFIRRDDPVTAPPPRRSAAVLPRGGAPSRSGRAVPRPASDTRP